MRIRKRKEEEPGDLEELEGQYFPEDAQRAGSETADSQQKYTPRHKKGSERIPALDGGRPSPGIPLEQPPPVVETQEPSGGVPLASEQSVLPQAEVPPVVHPQQPEFGAIPQTPHYGVHEVTGETAEERQAAEGNQPEREGPAEAGPPGYGYYWVPPGMYPPPYPPQPYGYGGVPPEMAGQPGVGFPYGGHGMPYPAQPMGAPYGEPVPPIDESFAPHEFEDDLGFEDLAVLEESHWRADFKWVFGILCAVFISGTLLFLSFYRVTGAGSSRDIQVLLIMNSTKVESLVEDSYADLRSKARKNKNTVVTIPDIGVDVEISGEDILSMDKDELTERIAGEIQQVLYAQGYKGNLPMKYAQGPGEERARAVCVTFLGSLNKGSHDNLFIPIVILGGLAFVFFVLFVVFCRGWGKVAGPGILFICAALPGSLFLRLGGAFFWNTNSASLYEAAMYKSLVNIGSMTVIFFDVLLGAGALLLLIGVVGGAIAGRRGKRVTPFTGLEVPEEVVAGGPPVDAG